MQKTLRPGEYALALEQAWIVARIVKELPLLEMMRAIGTADAVGAIADPTLYRQNMKKLDEDRRLVLALTEVQHALTRMENERITRL